MAQRKQWLRETDRFPAYSQEGDRFVVVKRTIFFQILTNSGWTQPMEGSSDYVLDDGSDVTPLGEGKFKILESDLVIKMAHE